MSVSTAAAYVRASPGRPISATDLVVVIDTREQLPYRFPRSVVQTLQSGDYSLVGYEDWVAIERKTKSDAYSSLGRDRPRFEREMERLAELDYAAVVLEVSLREFLVAPYHSCLNPRAAVNTLLAWSIKYDVHVFFAGSRECGNAITLRLLEKYHRYRIEPGRSSQVGAQ